MIRMPPGPAPYKFAPPTPANMSAESVSVDDAVYHVTAGPFPGVSGTYNGSAYHQNQVIEYDKSTDGINWVGLTPQGVPPSIQAYRTTVTDTATSPGYTYYYRARAFNGFGWATGSSGNCGPSNTTCGTPWSNVAPSRHREKSNAECDTFTDSHSYANTYSYGNGNAYSYANTYSYSNGNTYTYANTYSYSNGNTYSYTNTYSYSNGNTYS